MSGHRRSAVLFVEFGVVEPNSSELGTGYAFLVGTAASAFEKSGWVLLPAQCMVVSVTLLLVSRLDAVTGPYMIRPRGWCL